MCFKKYLRAYAARKCHILEAGQCESFWLGFDKLYWLDKWTCFSKIATAAKISSQQRSNSSKMPQGRSPDVPNAGSKEKIDENAMWFVICFIYCCIFRQIQNIQWDQKVFHCISVWMYWSLKLYTETLQAVEASLSAFYLQAFTFYFACNLCTLQFVFIFFMGAYSEHLLITLCKSRFIFS